MSAGWTPSVHMYSQSRGKVVWDEESQRFLPGRYVAGLRPSAPATA
jgi:sarcosine oxidase subunit alpha